MAFNNLTSRTDAQALIPEQVAAGVIESAVEQSAALTAFRRVGLATNQTRMPVLAALPVAYFVGGDTGLKQTTEQAWTNKYLNVEEIACIVPVPENVVDDVGFDIWGEIRPKIAEAVGRTLDAAVFFGVNKPASWPTDVAASAVSAANVVNRGTNNAAAGGIAQDISDVMGLVEADGFDVNRIVTSRGYRGRFRGARDTTGQPLMDVANGSIYATPVSYGLNGLWPTGAGSAELFAMDASQFILGVRRDITYKIFTEGVVQDDTGAIVFNLLQQDMVAMRVVARFAWQVANPLNYSQPVEASRYPAGALRTP